MATTQMNKAEQSIMEALSKKPGQTAKEIGATALQIRPLVLAGLIEQTGVRKNVDKDGNALRGRPAHEFALTKAAKDRIRRASKKAEAVAA